MKKFLLAMFAFFVTVGSFASAQIIDATELAAVEPAVIGVLGIGVAVTVALTAYSLSERGAGRL